MQGTVSNHLWGIGERITETFCEFAEMYAGAYVQRHRRFNLDNLGEMMSMWDTDLEAVLEHRRKEIEIQVMKNTLHTELRINDATRPAYRRVSVCTQLGNMRTGGIPEPMLCKLFLRMLELSKEVFPTLLYDAYEEAKAKAKSGGISALYAFMRKFNNNLFWTHYIPSQVSAAANPGDVKCLPTYFVEAVYRHLPTITLGWGTMYHQLSFDAPSVVCGSFTVAIERDIKAQGTTTSVNKSRAARVVLQAALDVLCPEVCGTPHVTSVYNWPWEVYVTDAAGIGRECKEDAIHRDKIATQ